MLWSILKHVELNRKCFSDYGSWSLTTSKRAKVWYCRPTGSYFFTLSFQQLMVRAQKDRRSTGKEQSGAMTAVPPRMVLWTRYVTISCAGLTAWKRIGSEMRTRVSCEHLTLFQTHTGVRVNSRHKAIYFEVDIKVLAMTLLLLLLWVGCIAAAAMVNMSRKCKFLSLPRSASNFLGTNSYVIFYIAPVWNSYR